MYGNGCNRNGYYYNGGRTKAVCFMRRNFCQACSFLRYGVKTRKNIEHTCGLEPDEWPIPPRHQYEPTKEEMNKYLSHLKNLMMADPNSKMTDDETADAARIRAELFNSGLREEKLIDALRERLLSEHSRNI